MTSIVRLGCDVADIHHQYAAVHGAVFGVAGFRLVIAAMTGRTTRTYRGYLETLEQLHTRLSGLAVEVPTADAGTAAHQAAQLRSVLSEYVSTLDSAINGLQEMCARLLHDEDAYRDIPEGGQSAFNRDKTDYDSVLMQLEQLGRRLNGLFSRF